MNLHGLSPAPGSNPRVCRKGRGYGSGNGKTAGRGRKGRQACSDDGIRAGFESSQIPLTRRIPKRGFYNIFTKPLETINVSAFEKLEGDITVNMCDLLERGVLSKYEYGYKALGNGTLAKKLTVRASAFSASAKEKIVTAGGKHEVVQMIETIRDVREIPELRKKILFTMFALLIFRLDSMVPVSFIDSNMLGATLNSMGGIFTLSGAMNGTVFSMMTVFALGVQPYTNSSIIIQLLTATIPALERLQKGGGEEGWKKIVITTHYIAAVIGLLQGFGYYTLIRTQGGGAMLDTAGLSGQQVGIIIVLRFTAGSVSAMWLDEQIIEFDIGNGISIILLAGTLPHGPNTIRTMCQGVRNNLDGVIGEGTFNLPVWAIPLILIGILAIVVLIVFIQNTKRRIPVQCAKHVVDRKMYGSQSSHISLKVNMTDVMPAIFAQVAASLPAIIAMFAGMSKNSSGFWGGFLRIFGTTSIFYTVVYFLLIVDFGFSYSTMQFSPMEVASDLKKNDGFIPNFHSGKPTADFIHKVLNKITMFGAPYLAIIAIAPIVIDVVIGVSSLAIGGTSIIVVAGAALKTTKALEAQMPMRHYRGSLE